MAETGRPSSFTQETADAICARMADGQSLREVCRADGMPDKKTVLRWVRERAEFRAQYEEARGDLLEHWSDEIVEIADDSTNDWKERRLQNGETDTVVDTEHINRSRLRIDTRKWLMSKLGARKYGDKITHAGDPEAPLMGEAPDSREVAKAVLAILQGAVKPEVSDPD